MTKLDNTTYSAVRGFNYQPGYAKNGLDSWVDKFDPECIAKEMSWGKKHYPGINTLRVWLSFDAWLDDPEAMGKAFDTVIDIGGRLGLKFIPTLFNGWHSIPDFGGVTVEQVGFAKRLGMFEPYLERIVGKHANDDRILLWDLCNEPFNSASEGSNRTVMLDWLTECYHSCKSLGAVAPVAVGATPAIEHLAWLEPISDVITFHPYYAWNEWMTERSMFEDFLEECVRFGNQQGKPMIATETCWGSLDDAQRADNMAFELGALAKRGIGFTAHLMCHSKVADANRRWMGDFKGAGYMAFIEADGSMRAGHEVFNKI